MDLRPISKVELQLARLEAEFPKDTVVQFVYAHPTNGWKIRHTLTMRDHWSITKVNNLYINVDFLLFHVFEWDGFEDLLAKTEAIYFEGILYRFERPGRPIGRNRVWSFKLEPLSEFANEVPTAEAP